MYQIGVIGCGRIAQVRHIPEYANREDAVLAGFYDRNRGRAEQMAAQYGGAVFDSYQGLLADPNIHAVSVCVTNSDHAEVATAALRAGKHVLCEKPMAMSPEECEDMVRAAKETGRVLMIDHNQRLAKAHARAGELVKEGLIGDVVSFQTNFVHSGPESWSVDAGSPVWFFDKKRSGMGAMADLGVHKTDLIQFLTGSKVAEVMAWMETLDKRDENGRFIGVEDNAFCIYKMDNGCMGTVTVGWTCYGKENNSTILYGTKGVMKLYSDPAHSIVVELKGGETLCYDLDQIQTNDNQTKSGVIDLFLDCLTAGTPPKLSGEEALSAMKAVFAAAESSRTGRRIKVSG